MKYTISRDGRRRWCCIHKTFDVRSSLTRTTDRTTDRPLSPPSASFHVSLRQQQRPQQTLILIFFAPLTRGSTCVINGITEQPKPNTDKAIVGSRLRSRYATHDEKLLVFIVERNLVGIVAVMLVVFYCHLETHMMHHRVIMSSTKPEVHNISQRRRSRTEPRP